MYPNTSVQLLLESTVRPNVTANTTGVILRCGGQVTLYAAQPLTNPAYLMTLDAVCISAFLLLSLLIYMNITYGTLYFAMPLEKSKGNVLCPGGNYSRRNTCV